MSIAKQRAEEWSRGLYALRSEPSLEFAFQLGYEQAEREIVTVEKALDDLRGMFPESIAGVSAEQHRNGKRYIRIHVRSEREAAHYVTGETVAHCMAKIREWKEKYDA